MWSYNEVKYFIEVESDSGCKLLSSEYKNNKQKLSIECKCGSTFDKNFSHFKDRKQQSCNQCSKRIKWRFDDVKSYIETETNGEYVLLSRTYKRKKDKLLILHKTHDHSFEMTFDQFHRGQRCPDCKGNRIANTRTFTHEKFCKILQEKTNGEYEILSHYTSMKDKSLFKHVECGHIWFVLPNSIIQHKTCPKCNESKGERRIREWLSNANIEFEQQKEFEELLGVGNKHLSYDFYLVKNDLLIEFQGKQHEKFIIGFHKNKNEFRKQQEHDKRKREYAKEHNIELLEIWYWDFDNIEKIIKSKVYNT